MKLKTLKEMDMIDIEDRKGFTEEVVRVEELKAEAIKWVKKIRMEHHGAQIPELLGENPKAEWIKHFFNITEEDLI